MVNICELFPGTPVAVVTGLVVVTDSVVVALCNETGEMEKMDHNSLL
jgi:hypothetical protein